MLVCVLIENGLIKAIVDLKALIESIKILYHFQWQLKELINTNNYLIRIVL